MLSIKFDDTYLNKNQISHSVKPAKMKVKCFGCGSETDIFQKEKGCLGTREEGAEKASWEDRIPVERE